MAGRIRFTRQSIAQSAFYQLPKFLLHSEELASLTNDARVLYALLRNRHEMSIKNGWFDENDEAFMYFKREELEELLRVSKNTVTKAFGALLALDLIQERRQGQAMPNRIYLLAPKAEAPQTLENAPTPKIWESRLPEFGTHSKESERENQNEESEKESKRAAAESSPSSPSVKSVSLSPKNRLESIESAVKRGIDYDSLLAGRPYEARLVDEFVAIIVDVLASEGGPVRIEGEDKHREAVKSRFWKLTHDHVEFALDQFKTVGERITKKKAYITAMLYNATMEADSHYTNLYHSDRMGG